MKIKIALGTAQFGLTYGYGATNRTSDSEIGKILAIASMGGIDVLDTAQSYGTALDSLGKFPKIISNFKIVLRIKKFERPIDFDSLFLTNYGFRSDLRRLGVSKVYCAMIHHARDLVGKDSDRVYEFMNNLKKDGLCEKIGVSVYGPPEELNQIVNRYKIDVVQLPLSIVDQRFTSDILKDLRDRGVEIHSRSIFLQGLLLADPNELPPKFIQISSTIKELQKRKLKPIAAYLNQVYHNTLVDHCVLGVNTAKQLTEILAEYSRIGHDIDLTEFAIDDPKVIDPNLW